MKRTLFKRYLWRSLQPRYLDNDSRLCLRNIYMDFFPHMTIAVNDPILPYDIGHANRMDFGVNTGIIC